MPSCQCLGKPKDLTDHQPLSDDPKKALALGDAASVKTSVTADTSAMDEGIGADIGDVKIEMGSADTTRFEGVDTGVEQKAPDINKKKKGGLCASGPKKESKDSEVETEEEVKARKSQEEVETEEEVKARKSQEEEIKQEEEAECTAEGEGMPCCRSPRPSAAVKEAEIKSEEVKPATAKKKGMCACVGSKPPQSVPDEQAKKDSVMTDASGDDVDKDELGKKQSVNLADEDEEQQRVSQAEGPLPQL